MIDLQGVSRTYGEGAGAVEALRPLDLHIEAGTFVTVVGASGSGKSTLLNIIGLLDTPTAGRVFLGDADVTALNDDKRTHLRRDRIGFVFQFFNLLPTMTAIENVALPARLAGQSQRGSHQRAQELLSRVGLVQRMDHRPDQLSGGEMQRVAIARALMLDPPLLLADEPTGNLDSETGRDILALLRGEKDGKRTIVMVTHDAEVAALGDRIIRMGDGRVLGDSLIPPPADS